VPFIGTGRMDSGLTASLRPGMTAVTRPLSNHVSQREVHHILVQRFEPSWFA